MQPESAGPSLFALADGSARDAGLKNALKSLTPVDDKRVKVDMEMADFDALVGWIEKLDREHGVDVVEWSVNRELVPGVVSARMILNSNR
jgi:type II secretory pathway component PulM